MSDKTPKVKLNESHRNEITVHLARMKAMYDPIYNEVGEVRKKFKAHMTILMNLRIFAQKYGTLGMIRKLNTLYKEFDIIDSKLYDATNKLGDIPKKHKAVEELFTKYEKFCKK